MGEEMTRSGKPKTIFFIQLLLASILTSCARPAPTPALTSWSEQYATAKKSITGLGSEFVLEDAVAYAYREEKTTPDSSETDTSNKPIQLKVFLVFESVNPTDAPNYSMQDVTYNDHFMDESLRVSEASPRYPPPPASLEQAAMIQIGPHDALQATLTEGEAYMGKPADHGNMSIHLVWNVSEDHSELKNIQAPVWEVGYGRTKQDQLLILVNAQTGDILTRYEKHFP
jgi:hypothetical protein